MSSNLAITARTTHSVQLGASEGHSPVSADAPLSFAEFGLDASILQAIVEQGYMKPTPIQEKAIPIVLAGRDVMGVAQTGTGKTASFSLPIIHRLLPLASSSASPARHPVRALILTPTRELADQVAANVHAHAHHTLLRSTVVFGGVDINPQVAELRRGIEILIATPGRLLDHVRQKSTSLAQVQILVLDEADRMLDMGFLPDLQQILNLLPSHTQTLLFSATFSAEIKKLASTYLYNPATIEVAGSNAPASNVQQIVFKVAEQDKQAAVIQLIRQHTLKQVIVFCNSKISASRLAKQLERGGVVATAIHSDRSQGERMQALQAFKRGEIKALVATDVAARGLDIAELPAVINFDLPFNAEDYIHRIGRTGRAGASGKALSLCSGNAGKQLADIEKLIKQVLTIEPLELDRLARPGFSRYCIDRETKSRAQYTHTIARVRASIKDDIPPVDDFFTRPYESSFSAHQISESDEFSPFNAKKVPKRPLAALLGGFGMLRRNT
ncbi:DEAD/DEAH box helicase [Candidatus Vallotia cooleyia]|uniref:DEAD/DEAH box helicase n=1 Tax=Candidatus Vallotiella adelgis TaxID=1177211 RepID=UPI001D01895F|nr:DEAD/DEAH box helicase [Candidatus Vallotia cooleyia]UDG82408.1 ATP-dependent RNA helicase RhlE [Candidatus Vallotia cooleyia]